MAAHKTLRGVVMRVLRKYKVNTCPCGCGQPPVRKVGARAYCEATARILSAPALSELL
jgi:hypothetical protein